MRPRLWNSNQTQITTALFVQAIRQYGAVACTGFQMCGERGDGEMGRGGGVTFPQTDDVLN